MKNIIAVGALTLTSALYAVTASAGCTDPRNPPQGAFSKMAQVLAGPAVSGASRDADDGHQSIVGTWHVSYTTGGAPGGEAFIQWHSDGTEWENINFPVLGGNICLGSWKMLDAKHYYRYHVGWLYDNGILFGYFHETETDALSHDGNSYAGTNEQTLYDLNGNLIADLTGTASATRIAP